MFLSACQPWWLCLLITAVRWCFRGCGRRGFLTGFTPSKFTELMKHELCFQKAKLDQS